MLQKTIEKCEEAKRLMGAGATVEEACKKTGMGVGTWYAYKNSTPTKAKTKIRKYTKRQKFVDIPLTTTTTEFVTIVVCQPSQIKAVLAGIQ